MASAITSIVDYQVLPLDPRIEALQVAYIHKVVDTVQDLPNVLVRGGQRIVGDGGRRGPDARRLDH